jgi:hypothetical protein
MRIFGKSRGEMIELRKLYGLELGRPATSQTTMH